MNTAEALREASRVTTYPRRQLGRVGYTFTAPRLREGLDSPRVSYGAASRRYTWHVRRWVIATLALHLIGEETSARIRAIGAAADADWSLSARQLLAIGRRAAP